MNQFDYSTDPYMAQIHQMKELEASWARAGYTSTPAYEQTQKEYYDECMAGEHRREVDALHKACKAAYDTYIPQGYQQQFGGNGYNPGMNMMGGNYQQPIYNNGMMGGNYQQPQPINDNGMIGGFCPQQQPIYNNGMMGGNYQQQPIYNNGMMGGYQQPVYNYGMGQPPVYENVQPYDCHGNIAYDPVGDSIQNYFITVTDTDGKTWQQLVQEEYENQKRIWSFFTEAAILYHGGTDEDVKRQLSALYDPPKPPEPKKMTKEEYEDYQETMELHSLWRMNEHHKARQAMIQYNIDNYQPHASGPEIDLYHSIIEDCKGVDDYFHKIGELRKYQYDREQMIEYRKKISNLYNSDQYRQLVRMHSKGGAPFMGYSNYGNLHTGQPMLTSTFPYIPPNMTIKLPESMNNREYEERRKKFIDTIIAQRK